MNAFDMDLTRIGDSLFHARQYVTKQRVEHDLYQSHLEDLNLKVEKLNEKRDLLDKIKILFQIASEHAREQAKLQLETLITNTLQAVFGPMFKFEIVLSDHGGQPVAEFYVTTESEGEPIRNKPQDSRGGGVVDIVSLALRIAFLESIYPRLPGPIILDEPGKHVSDDYVLPMLNFLSSISEMFDRQIIMVTHNADMIESADAAFLVNIISGKSIVTQV